MNCPNEVADILLRILQTGVVYARAAAWSGDAEKCALEADHVHNLPALVREYSVKKLNYYWKGERPSYITRMGGQPIYFEALWAELGVQIELRADEILL